MFFTTKTRGLGTGLGLPLVRRVVERAGGALEIRSRPGAGATVRLRIPVVSDTAPPRQPVASVQIEDGRVAAVVRGFLEAHGARIDGDLALDDVDVLVVDASRVPVCGARRWITVHPPAQLVVLGKLPRAEREGLEEIGVTLVRDIHDIAAIERALEDAMEISKQEQTNE
jgi:chemotaxis protein histidine kinase CheA